MFLHCVTYSITRMSETKIDLSKFVFVLFFVVIDWLLCWFRN